MGVVYPEMRHFSVTKSLTTCTKSEAGCDYPGGNRIYKMYIYIYMCVCVCVCVDRRPASLSTNSSALSFRALQMNIQLFLFVISVVSAHFTLDYPPTTGFDEDQEPNPPCGGFPPDLSNLTEWPLSGGEISVDLHHPEALFLFRAQLMGSDSWVNLSNGIVDMVGLGEGCIHALPVPGNWSGQVGVVQVVGQPPDAILYQVLSQTK